MGAVRKFMEIEIAADVIAAETPRVTADFAQQAPIPGFRPGKIHRNVVRRHFPKEMEKEVMDRLLPRTFREAVDEKGVTPVGDAELEHMDAYIDGAPIKFKTVFDIRPTVNLGEYRGLEIEEPKIEVTEADVDAMVERLREQASAYRPETERGLEDGDYAMIDITTSGEGRD